MFLYRMGKNNEAFLFQLFQAVSVSFQKEEIHLIFILLELKTSETHHSIGDRISFRSHTITKLKFFFL